MREKSKDKSIKFKNMKTSIVLSVLFLTIILIAPLSASASANPGIKPDSVFYFFDTALEKINLFFTFNSEKKAQKALSYADERLAEVEAVASKNKPKAVAVAMANYQKNISLAIAESKKIKDKEKAQNLLSTIADNTSKHQEVLAEVYNKVPDEAKKAIEKAIEVSAKSHEEALKEIQGLKKTVEELQKDIELLKQQGQSDQGKEIKVLREEIEKLKSQQSSSSAKPQVVEKAVEKIIEVPPPTSQKLTSTLSNSEIIEKIKPAVVFIQTSDGSGSGMIIESDGYVLTNAHVVEGVNSARIKLIDKRLFVGSVIGRDENVDLALLKINGGGFPAVELGNSDKSVLGQGDEVFSAGYSYGFDEDVSFKNGIISRRLTDDSGNTYLEITAEIQPGNSGGPLVNKFGQVVGINTFSYGKTGDPLKFAIPINLARGLIQDLKSGRNVVLSEIIPPTLPSLPTPTPSPTPSPIPAPQPTPAPKPQPVRTTISNIKAEEKSYGIVISWDINKVGYSDQKVVYSVNSDLSGLKEIKSISYNQSITISNESSDYVPATTYYYQIIVKDGCAQCQSYDPEEAKSDILSFTTKKVKPSIISVDVLYPSSTTAVILVKTDIESYSDLEYKKSDDTAYENCYGTAIHGFTSCDSITGGSDKKTEHSFTITNLNPEINYEYSIRVDNTVILSSQNNYSDSRTGNFKSPTIP